MSTALGGKHSVAEYAYSTDGELYYGRFSTKEEAAAEAFCEDHALSQVWVGELIHERTAEWYVDPLGIVEDIAEDAIDKCGTVAYDWLLVVKKRPALLDELKTLIGNWIDRHDKPTFRPAENPQLICRADVIELCGTADQATCPACGSNDGANYQNEEPCHA